MRAALVFRPFESADWHGYAGAESFGRGGQLPPVLADCEVDGLPAVAVLDVNGLSFMFDRRYGDEEVSYEVTFSGAWAARALALLGDEPLTMAGLLALGGKEV